MSGLPIVVANRIQGHLDAIAAEFKPGVKLTLLVRNPDVVGDADAVITNDSLAEAIQGLQRRQALERQR